MRGPAAPDLRVSRLVALWTASPFGRNEDAPWRITQDAETLIPVALDGLGSGYRRGEGIAIHLSATVEAGAVKPPVIIGPRSFVAALAYLRGGVFLDEDCIVGPGSELKTSFLFQGSKLAHLNFVGDSILGTGVNLEAGAIVRNERDDNAIRIRFGGSVMETGVEKFGAVIGDGVRIGACGHRPAILEPGTRIPRLALVDQHPSRECEPFDIRRSLRTPAP